MKKKLLIGIGTGIIAPYVIVLVAKLVLYLFLGGYIQLIDTLFGKPSDPTLYAGFTLFQLICILGGVVYGLNDGTQDTEHDCDICGADIKVGEGKHFPGQGKDKGCYCVCPKCLPTVDLTKLQ